MVSLNDNVYTLLSRPYGLILKIDILVTSRCSFRCFFTLSNIVAYRR